ncbi:MAG: hypothetical protein PVF18_02030 [Anaerolineales bacterium]|jgi:hypothetical protein
MRSMRASSESRKGRGCTLIFAVFWLAFSLLWTFLAWRGSGGLGWLFGVPFIAIGLLLVVGGLWRSFAALRVAPPQISMSKTQLRPGESFTVAYHQRFRLPTLLQDCRVELVFRESATYTQGTDTRTDTHEKIEAFFEGPVGQFDAGAEVRKDGTLQIPIDAMHSFEALHNKLNWFVRVHVDIQEWPDMVELFDLTVIPERSI